MKFLRRKTGDASTSTDYDAYVEPFPPARRAPPMPAPGPCAGDRTADRLADDREDWAGERAEDRAAALRRDVPASFAPDAETYDARSCGHGSADHGPGDGADTWPASRPAAVGPAPAAAHPALTPAAERPVLFPADAASPGRPVPPAADRLAGLDDRPAPEATRTRDLPPRSVPAPDVAAAPAPAPADLSAFEMPPPAIGRAAGRAKTRLLGFGQPVVAAADPFARAATEESGDPSDRRFPVGWIVVVDGPGRGAHFTLFNGVSQIGRGADQTVRLDFGDNSISRSGHALLAFDDEQGKFFLGSGGKVNIVRLNDRPLLSTEELAHNDTIRIGETTLRFVAFCGQDFTWSTDRPDADGR